MKFFLIKFYCLLLFLLISNAYALPITTSAKYALIVDYETGNVLYEKESNKRISPASMSKLMTLYILFEAIQDGSIDLDSEFLVSKKAWKKGGSRMFLEPATRVKVLDLIRGIIIQSGNDACIVVAEGLSGSEELFAEMMNIKAREIGLISSNYTNSTGWPDDNHYMSLIDLATLSKRIIYDFPEFFYLFKEKEYTFNDISQNNRNPLLYSYKHSDGLKTGYTEESGFALSSTAKKGNRRLILILSGMKSMKERRKEAIKLFEWAFREYTNINLFADEESIIEADVWLGKKAIIDLYSKENIVLTVKRKNIKDFKAKVIYDSPIPAPIYKDREYAKLVISNTVKGNLVYPLFAKEEIEKAGIFKKISSAISYIIFGGYAE